MNSVRLGNHELLIRLASGGAANVFLVRDLAAPAPGRLLALKILQPSLAANEDFVNMFFNEARIAAYIRHQNVVAIAGFGQVEGVHCLAMEYVFGASLAQVLRASARAKKPLTVGVLLRITATICDALHYAHELVDEKNTPLNVVHRDVTPQNILIGFNGVAKLTDFGIAKATNRGWETQAGIVKGKFSYMSPEQALGKKVDRRSDIFGAGIVLWEALTGRDLFKGSTPMEVLTAIREQKIEPPSKVVPGLTPIVDPIVMRALRRAPKQRYQTAAEMRDDIEDLIRRAGVNIDAQVISGEFAAIYGKEIVERALVLRSAMAGKAELDNLAKVLGGSVLNPKLIPKIAGGLTDPDPLGLFSEESGDLADVQLNLSSLPARIDRSFTQAPVSTDFDVEEVHPEANNFEASQFEPAPMEHFDPQPVVPEERQVSGWEDNSTSMAVPDDELLSMISEEDATIGFLPPEFAERFGRELRRVLDVARDPFDDEATVGLPSSPDLAELRAIRDDDSRGRIPWEYDKGKGRISVQKTETVPARRAPRAPSILMEEARRRRVPTRPVPRAPSLDMEDQNTPVPQLEYDPVAEPPLPAPSRPAPPSPPPVPRVPASADDFEALDSEVSGISRLMPPDEPMPSMPGLPVMVDDVGEVSQFGAPMYRAPVELELPPRQNISKTEEPLHPSMLQANGKAKKPETLETRPPEKRAPPPPPPLERAPSLPPEPKTPERVITPGAPKSLVQETPADPVPLSPLHVPEPKPQPHGIQLSVPILVILVVALVAIGVGIGLFLR